MNRSKFQRDGESSLLCLYYPQQLLPGLAAVMSYRRHHGRDVKAPLTVLVWSHPATVHKTRARRLQAFKMLLEGFPWATLFFPEQNEVKAHLSHNSRVMRKADYLRGKYGLNAFTAVYFAHDISADFIAQSAMQAFPNAVRICFGDALGVVYSNDYFTDHTYAVGAAEALSRPMQTIRNLLFRLKRVWTLPSRSRRLNAEHAVLILPCDPGGDFLRGKQLLLVDIASLTEVLNTLSEATSLSINGKYNTSADRQNAVVILLGSYSESKLTTEGQERDLYTQAARENIAKNQKIVLKPHPASSAEKTLRIQRALSAAYTVEIEDYDELPAEFIPALAEFDCVISFSYSSVSLKYLYGIDVLHALTDEMIKTYFPVKSWSWMRNSNDLYLEQLIAITGWNAARTSQPATTGTYGQSAILAGKLKCN